jgi:hypothetical protein
MRIYNVFVWALTFVLYVLIAQVSHATTLNADALYLRPGSLGTCSKAGTVKTDSGASNVTKVCDGTTWRQLVRTDATEVLTNKDIDGGTAANTSRITIPKDTKANLDALNRKSGTVVYGTDTEVLYIDNGTSLIPIGAGSGSATDWGYVENGGVEVDATGWSVSGGTGARTTTAGEVLKGEGAYAWDASAGSQTITLPSFTIPAGGLGNCEARVWAKGGGTADITFVVKTGSTSVSQPLTVSSALASWGPLSFNFVCTAGSATSYFIEGTSAGNAAEIYFDEYYGGEATNIGSAAQAEVVVRAYRNGTQTISTAAQTKIQFNAETFDAYGEFDPTTDYRFTAQRAGRYEISSQIFVTLNTDAETNLVTAKNGTQVCLSTATNYSSANGRPQSNCVMDLAVGDYVEIFKAAGTDTATEIVGGSAFTYLQITRFPTASEQVFKVGAPGLDWTAFTPTGSWSTNTTYTGKYQCNGGNLSVQGNIALTGAPTSAPLTINLPSGFTIDTAVSGSIIAAAYRTVPSFSSSILDAGTEIYNGLITYNSATAVQVSTSNVAGTYPTSSAQVSATVPFTFTNGDSLTFNYTVPVTADSPCPRAPMPLLKNAVTTPSSGVQKIVTAKTVVNCSSSPCTVAAGNTPGLAITRTSTGLYVVTWPAGTFSGDTVCNASCHDQNNDTTQGCAASVSSTSSLAQILTKRTENTLLDHALSIICMGPN